MTKYRIDVYIVDNHTMFNEGLTDLINHRETVHVSRSFTTLSECRAVLSERRPDVLLLDISMPDGEGTEFCQWALKEYPKIKIVALTVHDEYCVIQRMLDSGVHGYVLKSAPVEELVNAIIEVWQGRRFLSKKVEEIIKQGNDKAVVLTNVEKNILRLLCNGCTNSEIAEQLHLSIETVNWYRKRLLAKYGAKNTASLVSRVIKEKII